MGAPYQDGPFPSGAPILTIGGFPFKCNKISFQKSSEVVNVPDQDGAHSGALAFEGPTTGSAEVQFANISIPEPTTAAVNATMGVFQANVDGSNANIFITGVDIEKPQRAPWTATLSLQKRKN